MRSLRLVMILPLLLSFVCAGAAGMADRAFADDERPSESMKWSMKIKPLLGTAELSLKDSTTGKTITKARVKAIITMPDGRKTQKTFKGARRGKNFVFVSTVDVSMQGKYIFDVDVTSGKERLKFRFPYNMK